MQLGTREAPESVEERYNRLQQEIVELNDQVAKIKVPPPSPPLPPPTQQSPQEGTGEAGKAALGPLDVARLSSELASVGLESVAGAAYTAAGAGAVDKLAGTLATLREKATKDKVSAHPALVSGPIEDEVFLEGKERGGCSGGCLRAPHRAHGDDGCARGSTGGGTMLSSSFGVK